MTWDLGIKAKMQSYIIWSKKEMVSHFEYRMDGEEYEQLAR